TTIRASITAYSTAVGPSSAFRKFTSFVVRVRMSGLPGFEIHVWSPRAPTVGWIRRGGSRRAGGLWVEAGGAGRWIVADAIPLAQPILPRGAVLPFSPTVSVLP